MELEGVRSSLSLTKRTARIWAMQTISDSSTIPDSRARLFRDLLPVEFAALDSVIDDSLDALSNLQPGSESEVTRLAVGQRALTLLQGARLLLEEGHWELAAGAGRQMFEVLVNLENLLNQSDTEAAWESYRRYGEAQFLQTSLRKLKYAIASGYDDESGEAKALATALDDARFDEFRHSKGYIRDSWTGLSVEKLAATSQVPWRADQYRCYYRTWSEQTHGQPSSLISNVTPRTASTGLEQELASYAREARQEITMFISLFADLASALGIFGTSHGTICNVWREKLGQEQSDSGRSKQVRLHGSRD